MHLIVLLSTFVALCLGRRLQCDPGQVRRECGKGNRLECLSEECCWDETEAPHCFTRTAPAPAYTVTSIKNTILGVEVTIESSSNTSYGPNISPLTVDISMETSQRLHVKIYDPNNKRWEIPSDVSPIPNPPSSKPKDPIYKFATAGVGSDFWLKVIRSSTGEAIFDTTATSEYPGLQFVDQYISLSTALPNNPNIYGLGEHVTTFRLPLQNTYTLWTADVGTVNMSNLYGSHPIYYEMRSPGLMHGVFLRNSNGMDVVLSESSLTYKVIGGVLDFYFFLGPDPESVVQQYQEVIGRPHMPPYWSLGFHNCRWGYPNVKTDYEVVANYSKHKIPLETMWNDIDYMDKKKDFTVDTVNFPSNEMKTFISKLHADGQKYVVIIDPGIKNETGYIPYDDGIKDDVFLKDKNGKPFVGMVWPGFTVFPDFFNPAAFKYWEKQILEFIKNLVPVDGLWIDMNEISNFCSGSCDTDTSVPLLTTSAGFDPNNPPYHINNKLNKAPLDQRTTSMDCVHKGGVLEYNAHNLFGLLEAKATSQALEDIKKERSLVISRSSFPGSGMYTGHWLGDNHAMFYDLYASIPGVLSFNIFGIPLIGADICGFNGNTNEELCGRWIEVGAFYTFSRVHNSIGDIPQELYRWDSVAAIARKVLGIRYSLLPYYYTLFYKAHREVSNLNAPSATVLRPLFFEFPDDPSTYPIDRQFLVGSAVMISPVLEQGATSVKAYFPQGVWYDFYNQTIFTGKGKVSKTLPAPFDHIPIHLRGGSVIPMQAAANTTVSGRKTNFTLLVALNSSESASGDVYVDDGVSLQPNKWLYVEYTVRSSMLKSVVSGPGYECPPLNMITILGVAGNPSKAFCNGKEVKEFMFNKTTQVLQLGGLNTLLGVPITVTWE